MATLTPEELKIAYTPVYPFGKDFPIMDFVQTPYVMEFPLDRVTVRPTASVVEAVGLNLYISGDDTVPDFNTAVIELGEPPRGSEEYETLALIYQYGYDGDGNPDIFHDRWCVNPDSPKSKVILAELSAIQQKN